jgi:tRNA A37 threonylcarbamoyladenosine dehydratase
MHDPCSGSVDVAAILARTIDLLGPGAVARLRAAAATVVGLGGVGSHAASALVRSGIGSIRIVDFDRVTPSGLNRAALFTAADVGRPKTEALAAHLRSIGTGVRIDAVDGFLDGDSVASLVPDGGDVVVDAIDSVGPKTALLASCVARGLPVVSCMGASARTDVTALRVADLSETTVCPLAREVRVRLRRAGVGRGVAVVYSVEPPLAPLPPGNDPEETRRGRPRRRLPSLGMMPGVFGYALAGLAIARIVHGDALRPLRGE